MASPEAIAFAETVHARRDCRTEPGLTIDELHRAEAHFGLSMPALWREVLTLVHPVELPEPPRGADGILNWTRLPDWRLRDVEATQRLIDWPVVGVLFDVQQGFWWRAWGSRPSNVDERVGVASKELSKVPRLTPLGGIRYVGEFDASPVFSIHQTDLYIPFINVRALLAGGPSEDSVPIEEYPLGEVPFWSLLHAWSQAGHLTERLGGLAQYDP